MDFPHHPHLSSGLSRAGAKPGPAAPLRVLSGDRFPPVCGSYRESALKSGPGLLQSYSGLAPGKFMATACSPLI